VLAETRGELLFTHVGLSGPAVLTLSLRVARALAEGPLTVRLDLFPSLSDADLDALLRHAQAEAGRAMAEALFTGLLPRRLAASLVARAGLPVDLRAARCTVAQRAMAVAAAKRAEFEVARARPLREAMVTVGGVDVGEVEPTTMASRVAPGLYLAGELLDVAGETGGYNLQFAFSSGRLAGESAARAVLREPPSPPLWRHSTP
jgi:predicted Rossmann fold flavoprotein